MLRKLRSAMLPLLSVAWLLVAHVYADDFRSPRIWNREAGLRNSTAGFSNSSTTSSTSTLSTTTSLLSTSSNDTSVTALSPTLSPTRSLNSTTTTPEATCAGSVTYTGSVYPTVFLTVTQGFDVTVTASDAPVTESATLVTPLPACESTVVSGGASNQPKILSGETPIATIAVTTFSIVIDEPSTASSANGGGHPHPLNPTGGADTPQGGQDVPSTSVSILYSTIYSSAAYTSTVIVTKKTPVPVVAPPTSSPPVFQNPAPTKSADGPGTSHQNIPGDGASSKNTPAPVPSPKPNAASSNPIVPTTPPTPAGQPNPGANPPPAPAPAATINNVPVAVGASSIIVGTQAIAIPTTGAATVRAGGQLFTVKASAIIASGTTVGIGALEQAEQTTSVAPTRITAAPGVIITVQGTTAVIAGTTYRIGNGASSTVLTVSGQSILLGPSGVVLKSTTVPAGPATTPAPKVVEAVGSLTFSVDASEVVVEGTTYRIGSGAPTIRTTVDGQSLSIGPGGVGVGSKTTLKPTTVTSDQTGTGTASAGMGIQTGSAGFAFRTPMSGAFGWVLLAIAGLVV